MTNKIELLPCPFCGSDVHLSEFEGITSIVCVSGDSCAASKLIVAYPSDDYETALLAWNTRAAPAEDVQCSEVDSQCSEQLRIQAEDVRAVGDEPVLIQAVAVTREDEDEGLRLEWLLEGGISELEFAGTVLFAMPEANDICVEDGSAEVYRHPQRPFVLPEHVDSDLRSPVYGYARGWNACLDEYKRLNP